MKKYKINQDQDLCVGCGHCTMICEENWEMDDDTFKAKPKKQIIDETEYEKNKMAQEECPVQCIEIEEYTEE